MNKNKHFEQLEIFFKRKIKLQEIDKNIDKDIDNYIKINRKSIKEGMPKIGKIYKIIDIKKEFEPYWHHKFEDINYYAKIIHNRLDWRFRSQCHITCKADILDCNDNIISHHCYVDISNLSEDISGIKLSKNDATKVYLMFDKNTGYYKIGRSKNPKHREMTLQSEKPTIEMLFYFEAKNKDEKELHNLFSEKRIRGEWFDLSGTDINTIQNYFKQNT